MIQGKHVTPFAVDLARCGTAAAAIVSARVRPVGAWQHRRLAYRDVASPGNRLTLIAARLPPRTVSTHTLFCLKTALDDTAQTFLCGVMNSFVLNYLVRLWVATHVTTSLVERLPVPRPPADDHWLLQIVAATRRLESRGGASTGDGATLQAAVARLYGLAGDEFAAILDTFPLIDVRERRAALEAHAFERP